jgi:small-conductance mechanosensitive channel
MEQFHEYFGLLNKIPYADTEVYGNTVLLWISGVTLGALVYILLRIVTSYGARKLKKLADGTRNTADDFLVKLFLDIKRGVLFVASVYIGSLPLTLDKSSQGTLDAILILAVLIQAGFWGSRLILVFLPGIVKVDTSDPQSASAFGLLSFVGRVLVWGTVTILILDNLGVDITALVAGLGVGGIAVALAVQNVLGDLLGSLSIVLDKPFQVGDFIVVGDEVGTVARIGIKTTRVQSLSGEELVFANSDLLKSRIRNYKSLYKRRVSFTIGVTYETPQEKLELIPTIIKEAVVAQEHAEFSRSHLHEFGPSSLDYVTVFFVIIPDYQVYMDIQQGINLAIIKRFREEGIEFAYPTQTLHIAGDENSGSSAKSPRKGIAGFSFTSNG